VTLDREPPRDGPTAKQRLVVLNQIAFVDRSGHDSIMPGGPTDTESPEEKRVNAKDAVVEALTE